jgi:hypothetical protein
LNKIYLLQFFFLVMMIGLILCFCISKSYYLYNEFLLQASVLDLLTRTRINVLKKLVAVIFFTIWFVSCWLNLFETDDRMHKFGLNRVTFFLWSAFGLFLFKIYYDFAGSIRPVFDAAVTYQYSEYLQRIGIFCLGISLSCYLLSFWLVKIIGKISKGRR